MTRTPGEQFQAEYLRGVAERLATPRTGDGMRKVKFKQRVEAGWLRAEVGDEIELSESDIERILDAHPGALSVTGKKKEPEPEPEKDDEPDEGARTLPGAPPPKAKDRAERGKKSVKKG